MIYCARDRERESERERERERAREREREGHRERESERERVKLASMSGMSRSASVLRGTRVIICFDFFFMADDILFYFISSFLFQ
jgi:hypothetical protein